VVRRSWRQRGCRDWMRGHGWLHVGLVVPHRQKRIQETRPSERIAQCTLSCRL
jgi:hypothetical protein